MAAVGEPGRRTSVSDSQRVTDDARRHGGGVESPKAGASAEGSHANDRADQHVQHTERNIGRAPPVPAVSAAGRPAVAAAAGCPGAVTTVPGPATVAAFLRRRTGHRLRDASVARLLQLRGAPVARAGAASAGRQLPDAPVAGRQLPDSPAAGRQLLGTAHAQAGGADRQRAQLHEREVFAHQRGNVQLPGAAVAAIVFLGQLPGAHQRQTVQPRGQLVFGQSADYALFARRQGRTARWLFGNEFQ